LSYGYNKCFTICTIKLFTENICNFLFTLFYPVLPIYYPHPVAASGSFYTLLFHPLVLLCFALTYILQFIFYFSAYLTVSPFDTFFISYPLDPFCIYLLPLFWRRVCCIWIHFFAPDFATSGSTFLRQILQTLIRYMGINTT
jgi:hypothetical protein